MPIRMIAKELYRLVQEVEKLERRIENASFEAQKELKDQLRNVKAERDHMRKILDGKKE
jgi:hypothetical protein